jgi:hypothetical protein
MYGDRHDREFWPLLSNRFPSYEVFGRLLIVPLTNRIDQKVVYDPDKWIRFRPNIPERYEQTAMFHYSVFYFLGRAVNRLVSERKMAAEYPEDVLFLLDSVGDNFKQFRRAMDDLGSDCGCKVFGASVNSKEPDPFTEISDYRDTFLHNAVIGRGIAVEQTYIPKWNADRSSSSPLEQAKKSWRTMERLSPDDLVRTNDLLERLIDDVCSTLETAWVRAIDVVKRPTFDQKMKKILGLSDRLPLAVCTVPAAWQGSGSGSCITSLGSNTTFAVRPASGDHQTTPPERPENLQ